jgi:hypothetical protein
MSIINRTTHITVRLGMRRSISDIVAALAYAKENKQSICVQLEAGHLRESMSRLVDASVVDIEVCHYDIDHHNAIAGGWVTEGDLRASIRYLKGFGVNIRVSCLMEVDGADHVYFVYRMQHLCESIGADTMCIDTKDLYVLAEIIKILR